MDKPFPDIKELLPKNISSQPPVPEGMKTFTIYRHYDETGVSGTGIIIQGVIFANNACAIQWLKGPDPGDTQVKGSWDKFLDTHIRSQPDNKTVITFSTGEQIFFPETKDKQIEEQ